MEASSGSDLIVAMQRKLQQKWRTRTAAAGFALAAVLPGPASAHPHVWVTATLAPVFDAAGRFLGVHEKWAFDDTFTDSIIADLDVNKDGMLEPAEIQNAPATGDLWFVPRTYFTRITADGMSLALAEVRDLKVDIPGARMTMEFTLMLTEPRAVKGAVGIDVFDPDYYVAVDLAEPPIDASGLPPTCEAHRRIEVNLDPTAVMLLRRLGLTTDASILNDPAAGFPGRAMLECR